MQNEYFEQLNIVGKTSYEAIQELGTINAKVLQKLTDLQFDFANLTIESSVEQAKLLSSTTNYKDLLTTEPDFASDYSNKALEITRQAASILTESRDEWMSWFEKGVEATGKTAKITAKRVSKKADSE